MARSFLPLAQRMGQDFLQGVLAWERQLYSCFGNARHDLITGRRRVQPILGETPLNEPFAIAHGDEVIQKIAPLRGAVVFQPAVKFKGPLRRVLKGLYRKESVSLCGDGRSEDNITRNSISLGDFRH